MKKQNLILLTKQFPFLQKEQYVAHELKYLAAAFERVFIYPHDYFGDSVFSEFDLPPNVQVIHLNKKIVPAPKVEILQSFARAFAYELLHASGRISLIRDIKRYLAIYAAQYALGNGLIRWMHDENIHADNTVFYSYWFSNSALCLAILRKRGLINSFVSRAHSLDLYHEDWGLLNEIILVPPFRHLKQASVDKIFSITEHGKDYLLKRFSKLNVETAWLGVDDFGINPPAKSKEEKLVLVTCSGFDENKRLHLLGAALSRLEIPVHWIHFGDGALRREAEMSVTSAAIDFEIKGQTPNVEIRKFYASHHVDLFVNVSLVEGLPVTIMEALSHGIPVLATAVNGTPEAVREGYTGKLISPEFDEKQIDTALREMLLQIRNNELMRSQCRAMYENRFNASANYHHFAERLLSMP